MGAEIAARIAHDQFDYLDAPVERLGQIEVPVPYAKNLEALMFPNENQVVAKIKEMVETGECRFLEKLRKKTPPTITELLKMPGLGPKRVRTLYHELDVQTLQQLARAARDGRIVLHRVGEPLRFYRAENPDIIFFGKHAPGDDLLIAANLDPEGLSLLASLPPVQQLTKIDSPMTNLALFGVAMDTDYKFHALSRCGKLAEADPKKPGEA